MIVVDTTVLVYAVEDEHPLRGPCRLVAAIGDGTLSATTTVEVIQEFTHVRARRRSRSEAADLATDFSALFTPLLRPDEGDLRRGPELFANHPTLGAFDAVLAATVLKLLISPVSFRPMLRFRPFVGWSTSTPPPRT